MRTNIATMMKIRMRTTTMMKMRTNRHRHNDDDEDEHRAYQEEHLDDNHDVCNHLNP